MKHQADKPSIALLYGWGEGRGLGSALNRELRDNGFRVIKKAQDADVILAHSGGIFSLPVNPAAKLILIIGVPYWPGKGPLKSFREKVKQDVTSNTVAYLARKASFNTLYSIIKPMHHVKM